MSFSLTFYKLTCVYAIKSIIHTYVYIYLYRQKIESFKHDFDDGRTRIDFLKIKKHLRGGKTMSVF